MSKISLESNSLVAMRLFIEEIYPNHSQGVMINDAYAILNRTASMLTHVYREANLCADHLARLGAESTKG